MIKVGMDTGAYKSFMVTENNEVQFQDYYSDVEKENLKFPNAEFVRLSDCLDEMTHGQINLRKHLIWDKTDYENPDYTETFNQMNTFSFKEALVEGEKAKAFILNRSEEVNTRYGYIFDANDVLNDLLNLWQKGYYVVYDY